MNCVTRFAPSPSGFPTAGNIRTALFAWLLAKHHGGTYLTRIEDTNAEKSTKESVDVIFDTLDWLGIKSDVEVVYQSRRTEIHKEYVNKLLELGLAYKCYCSAETIEAKREAQVANKENPRYDRTCYGKPEQPGKPYVVRFKVPDHGNLKWRDLIVGRVNVLNVNLTDFILQRTDGTVTFLLANMIDDALQGVTHVIRGSDGIAHCHPQILLYEALGFPVPEFGHLPFVLNDKGEKLSKRNGDDSVISLRDKGYLPEAVINAFARIGWSHGNQEIFSVEELVSMFDGSHIGKSAGVFDPAKLEHVNSHWIKVGDVLRISDLLMPFLIKTGIDPEQFKKVHIHDVVKSLQKRAKTLVEMAEMAQFYYTSDFPVERKLTGEEILWLTCLVKKLENSKCTLEDVEIATKAACEVCEVKVRQIGPAIRMALCGREAAPGIYEVMCCLGVEEVISRIKTAILQAQ